MQSIKNIVKRFVQKKLRAFPGTQIAVPRLALRDVPGGRPEDARSAALASRESAQRDAVILRKRAARRRIPRLVRDLRDRAAAVIRQGVLRPRMFSVKGIVLARPQDDSVWPRREWAAAVIRQGVLRPRMFSVKGIVLARPQDDNVWPRREWAASG
jgi:hypothetical protein